MPVAQLIDALVGRTAQWLAAHRRRPESTYRLQFNASFTFRDALRIVPYLHELGITDAYASPYLQARPGSTHGYDISNHNALNPEIGSEADHDALVAALRDHGMGLVLDVVPNHMGIVGNANTWWNDVLENGPASPYAGFFDIAWHSSVKPELHDKVLLPILGDPYGKVLEAGQLQLHFEAGAFVVTYFDHRFPVDPGTYAVILQYRQETLEQELGPTAEPFLEYQSIRTAIAHLPLATTTDPAHALERLREKEVIKRRLAALTETSPAVRSLIESNVAAFNGSSGDPHSFDALDDLLNRQPYRLCYWRVASDEINYRRFFDINELAALRMERPEVFAATHALVLRLLAQGKVSGVRIDHPDGLFDPKGYLDRLQDSYLLECCWAVAARDPAFRDVDWEALKEPLRQALRASTDPAFQNPLYVVVEKILGRDEPLPADWPVAGTTGYDFLNFVNGLFVPTGHVKAMTQLYGRFTHHTMPFPSVLYHKKFLILQVALSSELHMLAHQLDRLSEKNRWSRDFTLTTLRHALRDIIACFPVYRSYIRSSEEICERDRRYVETAVLQARRRNPAISAFIFHFIRDVLLLQYLDGASVDDQAEQRRFVGTFQQVTAPVMAKGMEDTAFYVYNRLLSLNEVGGDPGRFGVTPTELHRFNEERRERFPHALSATATHDTKRGEDVRPRLNVLAELPKEWKEHLGRWAKLNRRHHVRREDVSEPDRNEDYFLYQTFVGAWPLVMRGPGDLAEFVRRIQEYMQKATHEAKVHTSWINPNPAYDEAVREFVSNVLDESKNRAFLDDFRAFQWRVSHLALFTSLAQAVLKVTSPGAPDIYQGAELWDFSLVDPDNRRPVDYERRRTLLAGLKSEAAGGDLPDLCRRLVQTKEDGRIKLYTLWRALTCRRDHAGLFSSGDYLPAAAVGPQHESVFGFARCHEGRCAVVCVPRLMTRLVATADGAPLGETAWGGTQLILPASVGARQFRDVFTGESVTSTEVDGEAAIPLATLLAHFPVALLLAQDTPSPNGQAPA